MSSEVPVTDPLPVAVDTTDGSLGRIFQQFKVFNMRNGDISEATSQEIRMPIAKAYHWVPIQNMPPAFAENYIHAYIYSAYHQLTVHAFNSMPEARKKKIAIILGTARAVVTTFYSITDADFNPEEVASPRLAVEIPETGLPVLWDLVTGITSPEKSFTLDDIDRKFIDALKMCAIGLPALQGYSLINTGHHYDSASQRAFEAVERHFLSTNEWFFSDGDVAINRDVLWHKACHPLSLSKKYDIAMDPKVKDVLIKAGAGSAAVRLPAMEPILRAANTYLMLVSTVKPFFESYGGSLNFSLLAAYIEVVKSYPLNPKPGEPEIQRTLPYGYPANVENRAGALKALEELMERNSEKVAYCYGFYMAHLKKTESIENASTVGWLKHSRWLNKLKNRWLGSFVVGWEAYSDYLAAMQQKQKAQAKRCVIVNVPE